MAKIALAPSVVDNSVAHRQIEADHGPWLFLAAPVSFALTLGTIIYLSLGSF